MTRFRGWRIACALLALGLSCSAIRAGEVEADLVFHRCRPGGSGYYARPAVVVAPVTVYRPCYDPCPPVGPVRRFLRRVFHPCCPPPPPAVFVPAPVAPPVVVAPPCPRPPVVPGPMVQGPFGPPATIAPPTPPAPTPPAPTPPAPTLPSPTPPDPPTPFPSAGSSLRRGGVLTPPTPPAPVPIRVDRIASVGGDRTYVARAQSPAVRVPITLVHASRPELRRQATADETGRFALELEPGGWRVYARDETGRNVFKGVIDVRERKIVRVQLNGR